MILRFKRTDGTQMEFELGDRPITIGRGPEADLVILDDKVSRLHCGIRLWDGDFIIKDLRSKNGTFVNGRRVEMAKLNPGDRIRIGSCVFSLDAEPGKGTTTILQELADEMAEGKGYTTMLDQLVADAATPRTAGDEVEVADMPASAAPTPKPPTPAAAPETVVAPKRRVIRVRMSPHPKNRH